MEQFVLGIFQEHLSKFIVGFRKEQVNANLLNGKGEIKDVSLNCVFLNEILKKVTPFVELESVHVSKLSFHVTAWANLKKAPIVVDIEDVTATIVEPLGFLDKSQRRTIQQVSQAELNEFIQQGLHKLRGAYNLFDRIVDNIHVEMRSLKVSFQPWGKFKTCRVGVWTPPTILMELRHIKYVCVDEYGQEGTPEQVWNHNRHQPGVAAPHRTIMIYKKLSLQCTMGLKDAVSGDELPSLIRDAQVEVHVAFRKRLRDAAVLAVQVDVTARKVEVHIPTETVPMMAHAMAGVQYCLGKDRAFEDPLVTKTDVSTENVENGEVAVDETKVVVEEEPLDEGGDEEEEDEDLMEVEMSQSVSESDEEESEEVPTKPEPPAKQSSFISMRSQSGYQRRPVIILPNGLVIHERLSLSLSVHQCTVRGIYSDKDDGYIQLVTKGLVTEAMWPKDSGEKGGYVQASLSYVSLQERYGKRIRSILLGGIQHDLNKLPIGLPGKPRPEKGADSSFPLFEDRSIRHDPFGLRHTFPEQAIGMKSTVSYIESVSNPDEEDVMVLHEIGIDQFDVLGDSDAWCRALRFAMNENGDGFDDRWHSGDWSDELTTDMLVNPSQTLNLEDHLQPKKELFLDENFMISSDLMNVTARIMNVEIRLPAAIQKDVRSCDIITTVSETMLVVSSALPRTFLTGKIGASIHGEGAEGRGRIDFPNDPSDLCYSLEDSEDPSMRQLGTMTARGVSTARCQLTIRGLSVRIVPVIPFCNASQPQQLVEPTEMTMIVCFEGEPPVSAESNLVKIVLFVSLQFHRLALNCDLDVVTGALSTIIYHGDVVRGTVAVIEKLQASFPSTTVALEQEGTPKMSKTLKNRRVLVRRQIARSREAGGLSVSACMQLAEFSFTFWRQNVPLTSRFRASLSNDVNVRVDDTPIALMKLVLFEMKGMELGAEWFVEQSSNRRIVLKGCLSELKMEICDFEAECAKCIDENVLSERTTSVDGDPNGSEEPLEKDIHSLIELLTFGLHAHEHRSYAEVAWGHNDILFRAEEHLNSTRSMSIACEVGPPGVVYLRVREIESLCLLLIEALLMPAGLQEDRFKANGQNDTGIRFPDRSVGALFAWFVRSGGESKAGDSQIAAPAESPVDEKADEVDTRVHASLLNLLPDRVNKVMAQVMIVDVLVFVPDKGRNSETADEARWLGLVVHQTRLLSGYFSPESASDQHIIMNTLASAGITWATLFVSEESGIHLLIRARPSLYNGERKNSMCITTDCLVSEFEITCSYHPSDCAISMGDTTLSVKNLDDLNHLHSSMLTVKEQGNISMTKLGVVLSALRCESREDRAEPSVMQESGILSESRSKELDPPSETEQSLRGLRKSLNRLREISESHSLQLKDVLEQQQQRIGFLRYEVFARERDRIAALALVSSQMTGWLRMGGTHNYGQRLSGVTTMWRYYAVLHRSLLILYPSPGQPRPMDIIFLEGAHLLPLAGGRRKRDVRRGFSIIESGGVVRFFMAENGSEFELWIRSIDRITKGSQDSQASKLTEEDGSREPFLAGLNVDSGTDLSRAPSRDISVEETGNTPRRAQIRERFSAVTSTTKSKLGSAAAGAKTRLGPAAASTKNKIGSAVQAARQRSTSHDSEGAFAHQSRAAETDTVATHHADSFSSGDHSMDLPDRDPDSNQPRRMGGRFAAVKSGTKNRFGSALQAAKEKGKAAAEQRRRRLLQERGGHDASQNHSSLPDPFTAGVEAESIIASHPTQLRSTAVPLGEPTVGTIPSGEREDQSSISESHEKSELVSEADETSQFDTGKEGLDAESSFSVESDDIQSEHPMTPAGPARRQQLQSKLGAAVQSVRRSTVQEGSIRRRYGSSGRDETDDPRFLDASSAIKVRGIHVGHGSPVADLNGKHVSDTDVQLKTISGHWVSSVEACSIETEIATPLEAKDDVDKPPSASTIDEGSGETSLVAADQRTEAEDIKDAEEGDEHVQISSSGPQISLENVFKIRVLLGNDRKAVAGEDDSDEAEVVRSITDVLALQTCLSECVGRAMMFANAATVSLENAEEGEARRSFLTEHDMNALDSVRLAGRLLKGLVQTGSDEFEDVKSFRDYQCELLKEFLNLTLDTPLPVDGVEAISLFLECPGMVTDCSLHQQADSAAIDVVGPTIAPPIASSQEILACTVACENDLLRLETQGGFPPRPVVEQRKAEPNASKSTRDIPPAQVLTTASPVPFLEPLLPFEITDSLHGAMHGALMKIMTERDEAHSQLIAASVLHVHEIEQERKRVDLLTRQLEDSRALVKAAQMQNVAGNFFADKKLPSEEVTRAAMKSKMTAIQAEALQNSEQDMLNLCQQLASEISAKTSASLEIIRLKESRKIERENEQAEKTALQNELRRCKEMLATQEQESREAAQEAMAWKQAYEESRKSEG